MYRKIIVGYDGRRGFRGRPGVRQADLRCHGRSSSSPVCSSSIRCGAAATRRSRRPSASTPRSRARGRVGRRRGGGHTEQLAGPRASRARRGESAPIWWWWARAAAASSGRCSAATSRSALLHGSPCSVAVAPRGFAASADRQRQGDHGRLSTAPRSRSRPCTTPWIWRVPAGAALKRGHRGRATADRLRQGRRGEPGLARAQGRDREADESAGSTRLLADLPDDVRAKGVLVVAARPPTGWPRPRLRTADCSCSGRVAMGRCGACCSDPFPESSCAPHPAR